MKKCVSLVLVLLLMVSIATADSVRVVIPNTFTRLSAQLPEFEEQPVVKTKTKDGKIMVRVSNEPDMVYANWLGYGESKEEVELENGLGYVELEGHKYQLGAKWNNKVYRSYFAYDPDSETWMPVEYNGTVIVGNTEMKLIDEMTAIDDMTYGLPWVWLYNYIDTENVEPSREVTNPETPVEVLDVLVAGLPEGVGVAEGVEKITDGSVDIKDGEYQNTYWNDAIYSTNDSLMASNNYAYNEKNDNGVEINWTYMVPYYQFYETVKGKASNGAPNHAWIVHKGPWTDTYTRAGKLVIVEKDEENTDYFRTGLAGNIGHVVWQMRQTDYGDSWYVSSVVENYSEGDIAKVEAVYNLHGSLVRYFITYRTDINETYRIKYTPDNTPAYGWYTGKDYTGKTIKAYTPSTTVWADSASHRLTTSVELDWGLIPLQNWGNSPRFTK